MALMMKASLLLAALVLCCRAYFIPELQQGTVPEGEPLPEPEPQPEPEPGSPIMKPPGVCVELLFNSV